MTTNYKRGYRCVVLARKHLQALGWEAVRTAGSHSPFDLVAWKPGRVLFVQVKNRRLGGIARREALEEMANIPVPCELWERHECKWLVTCVA